MTLKRFIFIVVPVMVCVLSCVFNLYAGTDRIPCMAIVETRCISEDSFQDTLIGLRKSKDMKSVLKTLSIQGKEEILNEIIDDKLLAVYAQKKNLDADPEVEAAIQDAIDHVLAEALIQEEVSSLDISETALKIFYQENEDMFRLSDKIQARHIITSTLSEAQEALARVKKGDDFQAVASDVNIDSTKSKAGDLGLVPRGIMVEPFENALFSLSEGEISDIVKTSFGYHIILAEKIEKGQIQPFETVKEEIKEHIINTHIEKLKKDLRERYHVLINRELLEQTDK